VSVQARSAGARDTRQLLRDRSGGRRVTNIELFFDLVYVFAVTQLSHLLLHDLTAGGALRSALLAMVWLVWAYTTWVTNWMDPERLEVRLLLVALMLISLAMSAALPYAFAGWGWLVGTAYAVQQAGRSLFMVIALRGSGPLQRNFERILAWCVVSGAFAVAGGLAGGLARDLLWTLAVATDVAGGLAGFATPALGRSLTSDWTIEGGHFAERCQAFILIALGEPIVIIGATLSGLAHVTAVAVAAFAVAFAGSVALWRLYFDRSADASAEVIAASDAPGRIARAAYHLIHPVMVAGIIVTAAGDDKILSYPSSTASAPYAWLILDRPGRLRGRGDHGGGGRRPPPSSGLAARRLLLFLRLHDDADAVVGQEERDVLQALGDREQQVRYRRLRVAAQHARRHPKLRAVVGTDVFLEFVQQAFVVHRYRCLPLVPARLFKAGLGILVQSGPLCAGWPAEAVARRESRASAISRGPGHQAHRP
jgi:low temperature requirement protein LtrA